MLPVVHAGAAKLFFVEPKTGRSYDPEFGSEGYACPTNVSGILGDFRLK
jgi:hypothetical protein